MNSNQQTEDSRYERRTGECAGKKASKFKIENDICHFVFGNTIHSGIVSHDELSKRIYFSWNSSALNIVPSVYCYRSFL